MPELFPRDVSDLLASKLPDARLGELRPLPTQGATNKVYSLPIGKTEAVVRLSVSGRDVAMKQYQKETILMERVRNANIEISFGSLFHLVRIPAVHLVAQTEEHAVMVVEKMRGIDARDIAEGSMQETVVWRQLGELNRAINSLSFGSDFSTDISWADRSCLERTSFALWARKSFEILRYADRLVRFGILNGEEFKKLERRFDELASYRPDAPRVVHGNISLSNCIIDQHHRVNAVFDFGQGGAVIPAVDIGEISFGLMSVHRQHFLRATVKLTLTHALLKP